MEGIFITFEGPDGSGKTTQIKLLEKYFKKKGYDILVTREPGGTDISEQIRNIILDKKNIEMHKITEALLYAASRAQHVAQIIKPALLEGKVIICDRFVDSSLVYQGIGRELGIEFIKRINDMATEGTEPDITFLMKISPQFGLKRKFSTDECNRLDMEKIEFHNRVYEGYLRLEDLYPERIIGIDAVKSIEEIHGDITRIIDEKIKL
ncbi:dTMP kinase [Paramaledivibacter caminithermalis]|jgi:dTMP kinase|uniref:Thymidylate kinase n=1 Tax=Paramaledivibacter caminithermalis (strain DSM 15212 / CIP 107654 / DViRD3) TaxID=1121301 RepID=A0A1M6QAN5_PARC5|nr:dTMP kinase [Paramaledivibacter caminithermalis]SHK17302.1 dTMP kinase [Paramaledivibacter caminithermalis DSM 15212]